MRIAPQVVLTNQQRAKLETYARRRSTQARLCCAPGLCCWPAKATRT